MPEAYNALLPINGALLEKAAERYGTPLFVYSEKKIREQLSTLKSAFQKRGLPVRIHYSVKANPLLGILSLVRSAGEAFDTVSLGEMKRCLAVGARGQDIVLSGSGKSPDELDFALQHDLKMINVESESELLDLRDRAVKLGKRANVALRINPDVDALTHEYITTGTHDSKFGVSVNRALHLIFRYRDDPALCWVGLDMHIGSQLTEEEPIEKSLRLFASVVRQLLDAGLPLRHLDIGGGLGIQYNSEKVISADRFAELVSRAFSGLDLKNFEIIMEPGRYVIAESGLLLARILHRKTQSSKTFLILDTGMSELIRPALYEAQHEILSIRDRSSTPNELVDVVGPICESSDVFGKNLLLPTMEKGELLAIQDAGAYGVSMESTYNSRPRTCQLLVKDSGEVIEIRRRETIEDLWRLETP